MWRVTLARMRNILTLAVVSAVIAPACGAAPPPPAPRTPQRIADDAPAREALRAGRFDDATALAGQQLALAPRDSEVAAIRAIASYEHAGDDLITALDVRHSWFGIDNALRDDARPALIAFADRLDAIDRDLETVAADPQFSLELCLACWHHDWNHDGKLDDRDDQLFEIENDAHGEPLPPDDPRRRPTFRFDVGDALWARGAVRSTRDVNFCSRIAGPTASMQSATSRRRSTCCRRIASSGRARCCSPGSISPKLRAARISPRPTTIASGSPTRTSTAIRCRFGSFYDWAGVVADLHRLIAGDEGFAMREVGPLISTELAWLAPDAYVDVGRMLDDPTDITLAFDERGDKGKAVVTALRGVLGPQLSRVDEAVAARRSRIRAAIMTQLATGGDTLDKKLRYLMWFN